MRSQLRTIVLRCRKNKKKLYMKVILLKIVFLGRSKCICFQFIDVSVFDIILIYDKETTRKTTIWTRFYRRIFEMLTATSVNVPQFWLLIRETNDERDCNDQYYSATRKSHLTKLCYCYCYYHILGISLFNLPLMYDLPLY